MNKKYPIPEGWNKETWASAMENANRALHFVPLKIKNKGKSLEKPRKEK